MDGKTKTISGILSLLGLSCITLAQHTGKDTVAGYSSAYFEYDTIRQYVRFKKDSVFNYALYNKNGDLVRKGSSKTGINMAADPRGVYYLSLSGFKKQVKPGSRAQSVYLLSKNISPPFKVNPDRIEDIGLFDRNHPAANESLLFSCDQENHLVSFAAGKGESYWLYDKKGTLVQKGSGKTMPLPVGKFYLILKDPRDLFPDGKMDLLAKNLSHYVYRIWRE